jgi:uncharacterized repeat protein (TIGR03803 family)
MDRQWKSAALGAARRLTANTLAFGLAVAAALALCAAPAQGLEVLYSFKGGSDGANPNAGLIRSGNYLYGTTPAGGGQQGNGCVAPAYCGTAFRLTLSGTEKVIYAFEGQSDGSEPVDSLARDSSGNLYGTALFDGSIKDCNGYGCGTVFKIAANGAATVLFSFDGGSDGAAPSGNLIRDKRGNLYGTASSGGDLNCNINGGCGTVFMLTAAGSFSVLHAFANGADGWDPHGGLIEDSLGNLYGTTFGGGTSNGGIVYEISGGAEKILYTLCSQGSCNDGFTTVAGVIRDKAGNLYGDTLVGGDRNCGGGDGCGTVFKLSKTGAETTLHAFKGGHDGATPSAPLIADAAGNLYGTTSAGGVHNEGTVFEITAGGQEKVLYAFCEQSGCKDGSFPVAGLIALNGYLYGTTATGGAVNAGTVFRLAE